MTIMEALGGHPGDTIMENYGGKIGDTIAQAIINSNNSNNTEPADDDSEPTQG